MKRFYPNAAGTFYIGSTPRAYIPEVCQAQWRRYCAERSVLLVGASVRAIREAL